MLLFTLSGLSRLLVSDDRSGGKSESNDVFVHDRQTGATTRVSVDSSGTQAGNTSFSAEISGDGRYVAFQTDSTNLVVGDTNGVRDIFVHDLQTGATTRVSVNTAGTQADNFNYQAAISNDGRYVAFESDAANLVAGDTNGRTDIFVHDRQAGATIRASVDSSGTEADDISYSPAMSGDGRYVAFSSLAENLVTGDTNIIPDIYVAPAQYRSGPVFSWRPYEIEIRIEFRSFYPPPSPPPGPRPVRWGEGGIKEYRGDPLPNKISCIKRARGIL